MPVVGTIPVRVEFGTRAVVAGVVTVVRTPAPPAVIDADVDALRASRKGRHAQHGTCGQSDCKLLHAGSSCLLDLPVANESSESRFRIELDIADVDVTIWRAELLTNTSLDSDAGDDGSAADRRRMSGTRIRPHT